MKPSPPFRSLLTAVLLAGALLVGCNRAALAQIFDGQSAAPIASNATVDAAIAEASLRFGVPEPWIRAVMLIESAGRVHAISSAGAIGLMQVMPATYAVLRRRYGLGPDPFDVRDNILAGTAYLREMHDRYGRTGMLAAYNAGPGWWEEHITQARPLPLETVAYVARLAPMIGAHGLPRQVRLQVATTPVTPPQVLFVSRRGERLCRNRGVEQSGRGSHFSTRSATGERVRAHGLGGSSACRRWSVTHLDCAPGQPLRACRWLERRPVTRSGLCRALSRFGVRTGGGQGRREGREIGGQDKSGGTLCALSGWASCAFGGTTAGGVVPCFRCGDAVPPNSTAPGLRAVP